MWVLSVLLGLLACLLLCLLLPVQLKFLYAREQFYLTLRVFGIPIRLAPKKSATKEGAPPKVQKESASSEKPNPIKRIFSGRDQADSIRILCGLIRRLCERTLWILKRIRFKKMRFSLVLAGGDAAGTALLYGAACAVIYPLLTFLQTNLHFECRQADLRAGFAQERTEFRASGTVALRPIVFCVAGLALVFAYFKLVKSEEQNNEREQH